MISEYENIIRRIIIQELGTSDDTPFNVSRERIEKWIEKREVETKRYKGINLEKRLIYYSDFYDLKTIIAKNWDKFKIIFIDKKKFDVYFEQMETFRNTVAHGRNLLLYQEKLIEGIIGELKTQLLLYHDNNMKPDDYFIKILKVSDNLGNSWHNHKESLGMITQNIIQVGDFLEIFTEAYDPKGREIYFEIYNHKFKITSKTGRFQFEVTSKMIGNPLDLMLFAKTKEARYTNQDHIIIHYTVIPKD